MTEREKYNTEGRERGMGGVCVCVWGGGGGRKCNAEADEDNVVHSQREAHV